MRHYMASEDYLHQETKMLPIKEHITMLKAQYTLKCFNPAYPKHNLMRQPLRRAISRKPRTRKSFPRSTPQRTLKETKLIYTFIIEGTIDHYAEDRVLKSWTIAKLNGELLCGRYKHNKNKDFQHRITFLQLPATPNQRHCGRPMKPASRSSTIPDLSNDDKN